MSLWVIIPVKPLNRAKSRLASVLSPEMRYQFAETMLRHILSVTTHVRQVTGTLVISRDTKALAIARDLGAKTIQESSRSDLNPALARATEVVRVWGARTLLILPADLPFINTDDISNMANMAERGPCVVIATDHEGDGTNAMLVRPPGLIPYRYGVGSYRKHRAAALEAGAIIKYYESERLMLDIDVPKDLEAYNRIAFEGKFNFLPPFLPDLIS